MDDIKVLVKYLSNQDLLSIMPVTVQGVFLNFILTLRTNL